MSPSKEGKRSGRRYSPEMHIVPRCIKMHTPLRRCHIPFKKKSIKSQKSFSREENTSHLHQAKLKIQHGCLPQRQMWMLGINGFIIPFWQCCHHSVMIWLYAYVCPIRPCNPEPCPRTEAHTPLRRLRCSTGHLMETLWALVGNHSVMNREAVYKVVSFSLRQWYCNDLGCWWTSCEKEQRIVINVIWDIWMNVNVTVILDRDELQGKNLSKCTE